jgi:hypothetical protein
MIVSAFTTVPTGGLSASLENVCVISALPNRKLTGKQAVTRNVLAQWDTGAFRSVISEKVAQELGLEATGSEQIYSAGGSLDVNIYDVNITLPNGRKFLGWTVCGGNLHHIEMLIGIDIINYGDLAVTNKNDRTKFSFQMPSTHDIDFCKEIDKNCNTKCGDTNNITKELNDNFINDNPLYNVTMNNNAKKLSYGISDFQRLITENYAYVDKTRFIETLENESDPYHVFIRPRKFGKSLLLSTLYYYYSINEKDKFHKLFGNLYIGKKPTPTKNSLAILRFDFAGLKFNNEALFIQYFQQRIENNVQQFIQSYQLTLNDNSILQNAHNKGLEAINVALNAAKYANLDVMVTVDDYDHFYYDYKNWNNYYTNAANLVANFYQILKTATSNVVKKTFITGEAPFLLYDICQFDIARNLTRDPKYNNMMGFTHDETIHLVNITDGNTKLLNDNMTYYFHGYKFNKLADDKLYNPTMILFLLEQLLDEKKLTDNILPPDLRENYKKMLQKLIEQGYRDTFITVAKNEGHNDDNLTNVTNYDNQQLFVAKLFYTGLLTVNPNKKTNKPILTFPNYAVMEIFITLFTKTLTGIDMDRA